MIVDADFDCVSLASTREANSFVCWLRDSQQVLNQGVITVPTSSVRSVCPSGGARGGLSKRTHGT